MHFFFNSGTYFTSPLFDSISLCFLFQLILLPYNKLIYLFINLINLAPIKFKQEEMDSTLIRTKKESNCLLSQFLLPKFDIFHLWYFFIKRPLGLIFNSVPKFHLEFFSYLTLSQILSNSNQFIQFQFWKAFHIPESLMWLNCYAKFCWIELELPLNSSFYLEFIFEFLSFSLNTFRLLFRTKYKFFSLRWKIFSSIFFFPFKTNVFHFFCFHLKLSKVAKRCKVNIGLTFNISVK